MAKYAKLVALPVLALILMAAACARKEQSNAAVPQKPPVHEHHAPHGGALVEIGEEFAHIELLFNSETGSLTAFSLDGEAENPVRLKTKELDLDLRLPDGTALPLALLPQASALTGETVDDTSRFVVVSDRLKGLDSFTGTVREVTTKGVQFKNLPFSYPAAHAEEKK
jgi:hypothetical protein